MFLLFLFLQYYKFHIIKQHQTTFKSHDISEVFKPDFKRGSFVNQYCEANDEMNSDKLHDILDNLIGIKNQIGYALNIGLLLVYMDAYIRRDKFKLHVYICIYFLTVVKVASSSSFIGASIILLYFLVPFIRKMILKIE